MPYGRYILGEDGKTPVECELMEWVNWFENANEKRRVARTELPDGGPVVSTVFLGLDYSFRSGPPLIFETMAFGEDGDEEGCERTSTWDQAEAAHAAMVEKLKEAPDDS